MPRNYIRELRAAFESRLNGLPGLPELQWENTGVEPEAEDAYIEVEFKVRGRPATTRGLNPRLRYRGQLALAIKVPLGTGPAPAEEIASQILDAFPTTGHVEMNDLDGSPLGLYATIDESTSGVGYRFLNHYVLPVYVNWYSYLPS